MGGMRYQPQGAVKLRRGLRQIAGAQSIIVAGCQYNVASGVPLRSAGAARAQGAPNGLAFAFRKNGYVQTEVLPAIGISNFVEFWWGVPVAYGSGGNSTEAGFLTGSNTNASGIYANWRNGGTTWGAILSWPTPVDSGEVLPLGVPTLIVIARYQDRVELWRDGRLIRSLTTSPYSYPAETLIAGSFIEDTGYWSSSSDTQLAGRIVGTWSADDIRQFSANPWQIFDDGADDDYPVAASTPKQYTLIAASGALGVAGATAGLRAARRLPVSNGISVLSGVAAALPVQRRLFAPSTAFTLGAGSAVLFAGRRASATSGNIAVAGLPAPLRAARVLVAGSGEFAANGVVAKLRTSRMVAAGRGGFAVVGALTTILSARHVSAAPGAFVGVGMGAGVRASRRLQANARSFALDGSAVYMEYSPASGAGGPTYKLAAFSGVFGTIGVPAKIFAQRRLQATTSGLLLSSAQSAILVGRRLLASPVGIVLQASPANFRAARRLPSQAGYFDLVGAAIQLRYSAQIDYARAPAGPGYAPQRHYNENRPTATSSPRPGATQRSLR